ncbi:MAG: polyribonucleotide nucleotidyltransferase [Deltaproteobacteria bacterium CG_4_8_14_3_um_filter_43_13]|nr:MAG: polyribonucleotide nucleotidyltransferase [Deltaproteobacteria bacterium CG06_land_8_20_14_3_00_44_19]PIX25028.1 MAG: polyribonucleotide nucleotidyltransferase [Deltaproteobacteria bacterium CG_4_8_14_3_um_filter_43_13]HCX90163.1 polyribonucleotide nucleotidyltransferase [Deltaproteobacteria bacterium]
MIEKVSVDVNGRSLSIETGKLAKQANGSVLVTYGETVVLVTAVADKKVREGVDFLPLTVDYQEMNYAAGKIPGGFFKREGRASEKEILTSRFIDRPVRPLFPDGYFYETQIIATVLSVDQENESDTLAMIGASAALEISDIPFAGPLVGVRIGRIDGELICNPTNSQLKESDLDLLVAGTRDAVVMVEGGANMLPEDVMLEAIWYGHESMQPILTIQEELKRIAGKPKREIVSKVIEPEFKKKIENIAREKLSDAIRIPAKLERYQMFDEIKHLTIEELIPEYEGREEEIKEHIEELKKRLVREMYVSEKKRIDGRGFNDIRPITCEVGVLPRTHGSAVFTRGETQVLATTTLGTSTDEKKIESIFGDSYKSFLLHYNFPPYSVGEVKFLRGPGRREIGHGALAERAIARVLPSNEDFPYTIRIVSDVLESNGSSSMATVCGGILSLMDAGVPIKTSVAGIAMGLMKEDEDFIVLSDILGDEDHIGDMDFKVTGTQDGITALQMDIKIKGVTKDILEKALYQAKEGRLYILDKMKATISEPRESLSIYAPRIITMEINPDKIRDVIGPGGKVIRNIVEKTGAKIDIDDSGKINIASVDSKAGDKAIEMIKEICQEVQIEEIYKGKVKKIMNFGAFVEILPGVDGLVHISQLSTERVKDVRDVLNEGDEVLVKVLGIDEAGRIKLSRKEALGMSLKE